MKRPRVLIADDHAMIREGVRAVVTNRLGWEVCAETGDGKTAVDLAARTRPDIAILDVSMPELNGIEATRQIRRQCPAVAILVLTMHDSEALTKEVLEAGARGLVLKNDAAGTLPDALEALAAGRVYFTPRAADVVHREMMSRGGSAGTTGTPSGSRLTPRERQLVQLLAEGKSNKEAAALLGISESTVETHRKNVMSKLKLRSTSDLVRYAIRQQWVSP